MSGLSDRLKSAARAAKRDGIALYLAARDPRVPWGIKLMAGIVGAYVLSPIDLIPDFIPVLGYLDEAILVPLAVGLILRSLDPVIVAEHRKAAEVLAARPVSLLGAALIAAIWVLVAALVVWRMLA